MTNRTVSVGLRLVLSQWSPNAEKAAKDVDKVGAAAEKTAAKSKAWDKIGKAGAVAAAGGALALGKLVGVTMDFDKAMSGVGAVANASAGDLGKLREAALKAGADTAFSASQAATAEAELAKAGVSTADILGGALTGSLNLAAAGQLDLGDAATISAQAMNIWKMSGKDVSHIADVLAAGANKSAADVGQLGDAMRQGGLVASQMGVGFETTIGTLSAFADNALIGSDAGTSLKTMLQKLMAPSKEAAAVMEDVGLRAFDASGQFVGMENFAGQLQLRLGGLTQEQRSAALATIFGSDAIRAANVLYDIGASGVAEYTTAVNDQGAAARMASKQLDNLAGDLEQLRGSVETALIKGGTGANTVLRGLTQTATGFVNTIGGMPAPLQATGVGLLALGTAGAGALFVFGSIAPRIRTARVELESAGRAGELASAGIGKVGKAAAFGGGVLVGLQAVSAVIGKIQDASFDAAPGVERLVADLDSFNEASLARSLPNLGEGLANLGDEIGRIADPAWKDKINSVMASVIGKDPASYRQAASDIGGIDSALANLVSSGHVVEAHRAFERIAVTAGQQGVAIDVVEKALPQYADALAGAENAAKHAGEGGKSFADATGGIVPPTEDASQATDELGRATRAYTGVARDAKGELVQYASAADILLARLNALSGVNLSATETEIAFRAALAEADKTIGENGRVTNLAKEKGRENTAAVIDAIKAAQAHAGAVTDLSAKTNSNAAAVAAGNAAYRRQVDALWRVAKQSGMTRAEFDRLTGAANRVPKRVAPKTSAPGADVAAAKLSAVTREANGIPRARSTTVSVYDHATGQLAAIRAYLDSIHSKTVTVSVVGGAGFRAGQGQPVGFQHGTGDAPPGWAWTGEAGPELVRFRGGEQVLTHAESVWTASNRTLRPAGVRTAAGAGPGAPVVNVGPIIVNAAPGMDVRTLAAEVSRRVGIQADLLARSG